MLQILTVSKATHPFSPEELFTLLEQWRARNEEQEVTGLLIHNSGAFMHVMEGEEETIRALHKQIQQDERHEGVQMLRTNYRTERIFSDWAMSFRAPLESWDVDRSDGYLPLLSKAFRQEAFTRNPDLVARALLHFSNLRLD